MHLLCLIVNQCDAMNLFINTGMMQNIAGKGKLCQRGYFSFFDRPFYLTYRLFFEDRLEAYNPRAKSKEEYYHWETNEPLMRGDLQRKNDSISTPLKFYQEDL